jgi:hypothetical protein
VYSSYAATLLTIVVAGGFFVDAVVIAARMRLRTASFMATSGFYGELGVLIAFLFKLLNFPGEEWMMRYGGRTAALLMIVGAVVVFMTVVYIRELRQSKLYLAGASTLVFSTSAILAITWASDSADPWWSIWRFATGGMAAGLVCIGLIVGGSMRRRNRWHINA